MALSTNSSDENTPQVYEDPENVKTWEKFQFKQAALVVSCMSEDRHAHALCEYMRGLRMCKDIRQPCTCTCKRPHAIYALSRNFQAYSLSNRAFLF
jgi:hypothetical protein